MQFKFQREESSFFITKILRQNYVIILRLYLKSKFRQSASTDFFQAIYYLLSKDKGLCFLVNSHNPPTQYLLLILFNITMN